MHSVEELHQLVLVPGFEGRYEINRLGEIWSKITNRWLKPVTNPTTGYDQVVLRRHDGRRWTITIHQLVALTFFGPCPENKEVCHKELGRANNGVGNLRYGTRQSNMDDHYKRDNPDHPKSPVCVKRSDGRVFRSQYKAGQSVGVNSWYIHNAIKTGKELKGYTWQALTSTEHQS